VAALPVAAVKADERPARREVMRLERPRGRVADHESRAVLAQKRIDVIDEPARVAELDAMPPGRQPLECLRQSLIVASKGRRQLPQDGTELRRAYERLDPLVEALETQPEVAQPLYVGQVAARLDGEEKAGRRMLHPGCDRGSRGQPVEGRGHLDRVEDRRVV